MAKNKSFPKFSDKEFTSLELANMFDISRSNIYNFEKEGLIKAIESITSKSKKYSWEAVKQISTKLADKNKAKKFINDERFAKIKVFGNLKGGVGKSTLASQFSLTASSRGLKTLLIDLDPQAHATQSVGVEIDEENQKTIQDCLFEKVSIDEAAIEVTPFLSIIPANLGLSMLERRLFNETKREERLRRVLDSVRKDWDLIVVDTNPSASVANINAILAADELCVVSATDYLSTNGLKSLFQVIEELEEDFDFVPDIRIIPNLYDLRDGIAQEALGTIRQGYSDIMTKTVIRKNTDLREAQKHAQPIWVYNKKSSGSEDIEALTSELLEINPINIEL